MSVYENYFSLEQLSISIGIAYTNEQYATIQEVFEVANVAIYEAKKTRSTIVEHALTNIS